MGYERYEKVIVAHGARHIGDLAYSGFIERELPGHPFLGAQIRQKLIYHPTVTREAFHNHGRLTDQIAGGRLAGACGLPPLHPARDRFMICGSPAMLAEIRALLDQLGFQCSPRTGHPGDYVFERAFVEK